MHVFFSFILSALQHSHRKSLSFIICALVQSGGRTEDALSGKKRRRERSTCNECL